MKACKYSETGMDIVHYRRVPRRWRIEAAGGRQLGMWSREPVETRDVRRRRDEGDAGTREREHAGKG